MIHNVTQMVGITSKTPSGPHPSLGTMQQSQRLILILCIVGAAIRTTIDTNAKYDCVFRTLNPCLQVADATEGPRYFAYLQDDASYVYLSMTINVFTAFPLVIPLGILKRSLNYKYKMPDLTSPFRHKESHPKFKTEGFSGSTKWILVQQKC